MSVLVKGMKMPENCLMCQFHGFGGYKNEFIVCSLTGRSEGQLLNVPDCPLVKIPKPQNRPATWGDVFDSLKVLEALLETIEAEEGEGHEQN